MSKHQVTGLLLAAVATASVAALPPKYLGIKDFKRCLAVRQFATYRAWCMPAAQPESCPAASWAELKALTASERVPACPSAANPLPEPAQQPSAK